MYKRLFKSHKEEVDIVQGNLNAAIKEGTKLQADHDDRAERVQELKTFISLLQKTNAELNQRILALETTNTGSLNTRDG
jgi:cell division septum initiation protein DivIVA